MKSLAAVAALIGLGLVSSAIAGPLAPSKPSQLVSLRNGGYYCGPGVTYPMLNVQENGDGTETFPFAIPAGQVLIVQDVEITIDKTANTPVYISIGIGDASSSPSDDLAAGAGYTNPGGFTEFNFQFPNGVVIKPGKFLCISDPLAGVNAATAHGFLTKDR